VRYLAVLGLLVAIACTSPASGVTGELRYVGGPAPGNSPHLEPGRVVAYAENGREAGTVDFQEGEGFSLTLPPGTYTIVPSSGDAGCQTSTVTVVEGEYTTVHVECSVM
jgi:hypothetical protein